MRVDTAFVPGDAFGVVSLHVGDEGSKDIVKGVDPFYLPPVPVALFSIRTSFGSIFLTSPCSDL